MTAQNRSASESSGHPDVFESGSYRTGTGVDLTLIRWMLSLTYLERLQALQDNIRSIMRLRDAKSSS